MGMLFLNKNQQELVIPLFCLLKEEREQRAHNKHAHVFDIIIATFVSMALKINTTTTKIYGKTEKLATLTI